MTTYKELKNGDIIFCYHTEHPDRIHVAYYIGNNKLIESIPIAGVIISNIKHRDVMWNKLQFGRIEGLTPLIYIKSIFYLLKTLGCRYQYWKIYSKADWNINKIKAKSFYCSELIWVAIMNATKGQLNISNSKKISGTEYEIITVEGLKRENGGKVNIYKSVDLRD